MGGQMVLAILALVAVPFFITRVIKSERRHKERMAAKNKAPESADPQPPAKQSRTVIPEIMAELNAMGEALDISRYALEASLGMRKTAWEARRGAPQSDFTWNRRSEYETSRSGQMDRVQPTNSETDLDNWYFSDDDSS